ncbi:hypothetical protein EVAR_55272_1 [Eumeta japonica]|uniref:Uncharacterized protein n=1 Tax=Eumeta variegata TaxID=151549 RepID=A0A4C1ZIG7_EUMVA|nr:hypothetical protein EVAR_55272_1 [Eumeta japonica]
MFPILSRRFRRPRLKPRASLLMSHCRPRVFSIRVSPRVVHCRHFASRAFHSRLQFRYSPNRVTRRLPFDESQTCFETRLASSILLKLSRSHQHSDLIVSLCTPPGTQVQILRRCDFDVDRRSRR